MQGSAGQAYRLYQAAFDRAPDDAGLAYWVGRLDSGASLDQIAAEFIDSAEFKNLYGANPTAEQFVTKLYNHVLHRTPDADGYAWWVNEVNVQHRALANVLSSFSESPENQAGVIAALQHKIGTDGTGADARETAAAFTLSASTVAENAPGAVIGSLTVTGLGTGGTFAVDDGRFEVASGKLQLRDGVRLDYEAASSVAVTVTATDAAGLSKTASFAIGVTNVNEAPTAIALSPGIVAGNTAGAVVGGLTVSDPDAGNSHTFSVNDNRFEVVAGKLKLKAGVSLDYATTSLASVTVTATDAGGLSKAESFAIIVTNTHEAPINVALSASSVPENMPGAEIGNLTVSGPAGGAYSFLVDDARFEVASGKLKLKNGVSLDHEAAANVNITVVTTDADGLSKSQSFTIGVTDVAETTSWTGTAGNDTLNQPGGLDDFIVTGLAGADRLSTGNGNDVIRPGEGADTVTAGAGNDLIVIVGQTAAGQYAQSDITNPGGSGIDLSSVITLADLNGRAVSEAVAGESMDGGAGVNRLVIYGDVDLSGVTLTQITQIQVNSTVTLSAQQLNALDVSTIFGNGESALRITNSSATPVTVDLSGVTLSAFRTLEVGAGVTVVLDQADVDSLHYLGGTGVLKASAATGNLNLAGKYTTLAVQDKDGNADATHGGGSYVAGQLLIGGGAADTLTGGNTDDRIEGGAGNDSLVGGGGNDVLRGGAGVDTMDGGAGDDSFVVVGDISGGGQVDSAADTAALGFPLTTLNFKNPNEDGNGAAEVIRGGDGDDTLYVYGTADLSNYDISGIEHVEIRLDVTFTAAQLSAFNSVRGDGASVLRISAGPGSTISAFNSLRGDGARAFRSNTGPASTIPEPLDLSKLHLSGIGQLSVGANVTVNVSDLSQLGGATILSGAGALQSSSGNLALTSAYSVQNSLNFTNIDAILTEKLASIIDSKDGVATDTSGNDYLRGTDMDDVLRSVNGGDDVLTGKKGSDIFTIAGSGKKIILDVAKEDNGNDTDTIDLSEASGAANIDLVNGGTVGAATVQLGSGNAIGGTQQTAPKFNLMLIVDVSGSMSGITVGSKTRMDEAKQAANELIDAYEKLGDISVRIVTFGRSGGAEAGSDFNGKDEWMDSSAAKAIINSLYASGGTPYDAAMDVAQTAFPSGKGQVYYQNGNDISFFLSDGEPRAPVDHKENDWENFLIANKITSNALGFGGLNSTSKLEPLAFDGTKVNSPTDDHTPGEIPAQVTLDASKIGEVMISQARLDFIENIKGTGFVDPITGDGDALTGNSLDNRIEGGSGNDLLKGLAGNDVLIGGEGAGDRALYVGPQSDYIIGRNGATVSVQDKVTGRDGSDTVIGVEFLDFSDGTVLFKDIGVKPLSDAQSIFDDVGYYTLLAKMASGVYFSEGTKYSPEYDLADKMMYDEVIALPGLRPLSSDDLNLASGSTSYKHSNWSDLKNSLENINNPDKWFSIDNLDYSFSDAIIGDISGIYEGNNSYAQVFRSSDSLFISFRGTDSIVDWFDNIFSMPDHYNQYRPLIDALDKYINETDSGIENVYVTGHSLGGAMAEAYLKEHVGNMFHGVTFEAAPYSGTLRFANTLFPLSVVNSIVDKFAPTFQGGNDSRLIQFEFNTDVIPDLGANSGYVVAIENSKNSLKLQALKDPLNSFFTAETHKMSLSLNLAEFLDAENIDFESLALKDATSTPVFYSSQLAIAFDTPLTSPSGVANFGGLDDEIIFGSLWRGVVQGLKILKDIYPKVNPIGALDGALDLTIMLSNYANQISSTSSVMLGGAGQDKIYGGDFGEIIYGGDGHDNLAGGGGSDTIYGGDGNDVIDEPNTETWDFLKDYLKNFISSDPEMNKTWNAILKTALDLDFYAALVTKGVKGGITNVAGNLLIDLLVDYAADQLEWRAAGNDFLYGEKGNDVYFVSSSHDKVVENYDEGNYDAVVIAGKRGLNEYFNAKEYVLPANVEIMIAKDDIIVNPSENFNILATGNEQHYLVGNAGNNRITGGDGVDVIIGGADEDYLFGGGGNDILIGSKYDAFKSTLPVNDIPNEVRDLIDKYADGFAVDNQDVSYLRGGSGNDTLYGSILDNDYFLIDVDLQNNSSNVDKINDFYVAHLLSDASAEDYLVFSVDQLGISVDDVDAVGLSGTNVHGQTAHFVSSLNFMTVSGIVNYKVNDGLNTEPQFVLDTSNGGLWFDQDGSHDVNDQVLLANISAAGYGWATDLEKFDADQILIIGQAAFDLV